MLNSRVLRNRANYLRRNQTPAERKFGRRLQACGIKFRPQKKIGFYIADFILYHRLAVIEIDGKSHDNDKQREKDVKRDAFLKRMGFSVIRIRNEQVGCWPVDDLHQINECTHQQWSSAMNRAGQVRAKVCKENSNYQTKTARQGGKTVEGSMPSQSFSSQVSTRTSEPEKVKYGPLNSDAHGYPKVFTGSQTPGDRTQKSGSVSLRRALPFSLRIGDKRPVTLLLRRITEPTRTSALTSVSAADDVHRANLRHHK